MLYEGCEVTSRELRVYNIQYVKIEEEEQEAHLEDAGKLGLGLTVTGAGGEMRRNGPYQATHRLGYSHVP